MFKHLAKDIPASIVVFFVALPLCLGIAVASDAPPFAGLIAGIIGGIVVGAISGSQVGVSGPAAGLAAIVLAAIASLGYEKFLVAMVKAVIHISGNHITLKSGNVNCPMNELKPSGTGTLTR